MGTLHRGSLRTDSIIKVLVLAEADEMLCYSSMEDQVRSIIPRLPPKLQVHIQVPLEFEGVRQCYVSLEDDGKLETLSELLKTLDHGQCVIFTGGGKVEWLADELRERGYSAAFTHGEMDVNTRSSAMREWRSGCYRVLVTTIGLVASCSDFKQVRLVINYNVPREPEKCLRHLSHFHSVGKAAGRKVVIISLVNRSDERRLQHYERCCSTAIEELPTDLARLL
ncbi:hypothetical protein OEZ86_003816 [Tetradesmus obliquus]|nr:hypothetical protein OEZ86_003816 [Tetradesmus obliquus]